MIAAERRLAKRCNRLRPVGDHGVAASIRGGWVAGVDPHARGL
jgi:hypothetical protein